MANCPTCKAVMDAGDKRCATCGRSWYGSETVSGGMVKAEPGRRAAELVASLPANDHDKFHFRTIRYLRSTKDRSRTIDKLVEDGLRKDLAEAFVETIYAENRLKNRRYSWVSMLCSGVLFLVLFVLMNSAGLVFFVLLPMSAIGFAWGLGSYLGATGYELDEDKDQEEAET